GQPDARDLVIQSAHNYEKSWRDAMHWSYTQTDVTTDDGGKEVDVSQIAPLDGTPYERVISKNGRPLTPEEQRKENEKYDREMKRRQRETPAERTARIEKYEKERSFIKDVPGAYSFRLRGEEAINGRPAWVVDLNPRQTFIPTTSHGSILKHIKGKLWIDKQDLHWVKAVADVVDTVSFGFILARIGSGAHISMDFTRLRDALWVPRSVTVRGEARVLLVHTKSLDENLTFSNYQLHMPSTEVAGASNAEGQNR
ncbi:MAG: hypothetical protein KGN84_17380, partial [Acidobacteriota bacterium]|nr:hypothetical protein [Acidobacteriota bacterium]